MLINPLSRPLDLVGDKEINLIRNEVHKVTDASDRIFVPVYGPFYYESLEIVNTVTGKKLRKGEDYKALHLLNEISTISTKEVYAVIYLTKQELSEVSIQYRVPGGKYTDLSELYIDMIKNYGGYRKPIYWSEILNLPDESPVVPHKHDIMDLINVGDLVDALDLVINAIYSQDFENWLNIYVYLETKLKELDTYKKNIIANLEVRMNSLLIAASPNPKEYWCFDGVVNPNTEYTFGTWERRGDYLLYGQMPNETNKLSSFDAPDGVGLLARKISLWQFIKTTDNVTHKLIANKTSLVEGGSVTFTLTTNGAVGGEVYRYKLTGVVESTGDLVLNSSGIATLTVNVPVDNNTNIDRSLTMTLVDRPYIYTEVKITDGVKSGVYRIGFYKDQYGLLETKTVNEGDIGYIVIQTTNVVDGTVLNLFYNGNLDTVNDVINRLPSTVIVYDNIASIEVKVKADKITDGDKYLRVGISVDNIVLPSVATLFYVRDTSKTPSANLYWANTPTSTIPLLSASEGNLVYLVLETENIPTNTNVTLTWGGSTTAHDFIESLPSSTKVTGNRVIIPLNIKTDNLTEGLEILDVTVKIGTDISLSTSLMVEDTSRNDNIDVRFSSNSIGTNNLSTTNEGSSIYLVIKTEDIPIQGELKLRWSGTANAEDFLTELPDTITIKNNFGYINLLIKADSVTEGYELLLLSVLSNTDQLLATQSLTIIDSSTAPTYQISFTDTPNSNSTIISTNEGSVVYAVVKTTQVPDGTVMFVETLINGKVATYANGDVLEDVPRTVVINAGIGYVPIKIRMDERKDGDNDLIVRLRKDSSNSEIITTNKIIVKDTSVVPTYNLKWSASYDNVVDISSATAGQTIYAHIQTTSIAPGTALYLEYGNAGIGNEPSNAEFLQAHSSSILPRIVRIDGEGKAIVAIDISRTLLGNAALVLRLSVSRDSSNATYILSKTISITKPTYTLSFASNQAGSTAITSTKEGALVYAVLRTTNVPNNTVFDIKVRIGNENATVLNGDVSVNVPNTLTIVNNLGVVPINIVKDTIVEGIEQLDFHVLYDHMGKDEEEIYFATKSINVSES